MYYPINFNFVLSIKRYSFNKIVVLIAPIVYLINFLFIKINVIAVCGYDSSRYFITTLLLVLEFILSFVISVIYQLENKDNKINKNYIKSILIYVLLCVICVPFSTFENIFGHVGGTVEYFNSLHFIMIGLLFILLFSLYFIFRKNSVEDNYFYLGVYCFALNMNFYSFYTWPMRVNQLPLSLCHFGLLMLTIAFLFKSQKAFGFVSIVNLSAGIVAMIIPNCDGQLTSNDFFHFFYLHLSLIIIPILCMAFKIFRFPTRKDFKGVLKIFGIYILLLVIVNSIFYETCDYYWFNGDDFIGYAHMIFSKEGSGPYNYFQNIKDNVFYLDLGFKQIRFYPAMWAYLVGALFALILIFVTIGNLIRTIFNKKQKYLA